MTDICGYNDIYRTVQILYVQLIHKIIGHWKWIHTLEEDANLSCMTKKEKEMKMKKLLVVLAALCIAAPAFAADNLELSGSFYLKGWDISNEEFKDNNDSSFFEQRLRIQSKLKANDNTYVILRTDLGEGVWGQDLKYRHEDGNNGANFKELEVDRVFAVMDRDLFTLTAGLQHYELGMAEVVDNAYTGIKLDLKFDGVTPTLFVAKMDENGSLNDDDAFDDSNLYTINVDFDLGTFNSNLFYGLADYKNADAKQWALGFCLAGDLGMVNLFGEIATFGGDVETPVGTIDFVGTQAYLKATANVTDMVTIGGELLYALGTDDQKEAQISFLSNDDSFNPIDSNSPIDGDVVVFDPFEIADNAGVQAITLFGEVRPMAALALGAKVGYFTPEDDDVTNVDSMTSFNAWVGYDVGPNTNLSLTYVLVCPDFENAVADDENAGYLEAKFLVKF